MIFDTPERIESLIKCYEQGLGRQAIAERFNCSIACISQTVKQLRNAGVIIPRGGKIENVINAYKNRGNNANE